MIRFRAVIAAPSDRMKVFQVREAYIALVTMGGVLRAVWQFKQVNSESRIVSESLRLPFLKHLGQFLHLSYAQRTENIWHSIIEADVLEISEQIFGCSTASFLVEMTHRDFSKTPLFHGAPHRV